MGFGYWKTDVRAALVWASWQFMQRDAKVTHYMWNFVDLVEGHQLQLTNNRDRSRTFVAIYMHANRLYIMEGTVPEGDPEPGLFQQSLGFVDADGNGIRYRDYYDNDYPPPARVGAPAGRCAGRCLPEAGDESGRMRDPRRPRRRRCATRRHHSHGNYTDTWVDLEGAVKAVHIINPHSWIYLDVKVADGKIQTWALEATGVAGLQRSGVTRETLKAGDRSRCAAIRCATAPAAASSGS